MIAASRDTGVEKESLHREVRATSNKWQDACEVSSEASLAYAGGSSSRMGSIGFYSNGKEVADLFFHLSKRIDGFDCSVVIWFAVDVVEVFNVCDLVVRI